MPAKSVLIIEPDEADRRELKTILGRLGYQVDAAANSAEGIEAFRRGRHDLVVVEVLLSGVNGLQVCKMVKEQGEDWQVKVVVVSKIYQSRAMEYDAINRYKADGYFARPFPLIKLIEKIGALIGEPVAPPHPAGARPRAAERSPAGEPRPTAARAAPANPAEREAPAPPAPPPETIDSPPPPDEGSFTPATFGRMLAKIGREKIGGVLQVRHGPEIKHIFFVDGKPVFVKSSNADESLGRMLVADGALTSEQYAAAVTEMNETRKKFGTVIAARGYLSSDALYYHLVNQTRLKIARCFAWDRGEYLFDRTAHYSAEATMFESEASAVVLEGYRRCIDAAPLEADYERDKTRYVFPGDPALAAEARERLTPDERDLLAAADGRRQLRDVVGDSPLGLMAALRVINALACLGAVRLTPIEKREDLAPYETVPPPEIDAPEAEPGGVERYRDLKILYVKMDDLNYFELLDVPPDVDPEALRAAFEALERKYHPEAFTLGAPARVLRMAATVVRRLRKAYDVLRDPAARDDYSRRVAVGLYADRRAATPAAPGKEPEAADGQREAQRCYQEGQLALEQRKHALAAERFKKAAALNPKNAEYQAKHAWAMFKQLDEPGLTWDDVERTVKAALAATGERADLLGVLGRVRARQGDDEKALRYLKKALALDPNNQDLRREARFAEQRLKKDDAKKDEKKKSIFGKRS